jgi:ubiquinone biosynthesis protein
LRILSIITNPLFSRLAKFLNDILKILNNTAKSELDLLSEAANASRMKDNLKDLTGFYIPKIYWHFSSKKILVMEWIEGIAFSDIEAIKNAGFDAKIIAKNLVISYFNQVYVHGFFHADMHPGNLILKKNGDIAAIDYGIVGFIDKKIKIAVAEILIGFLNKDYDKIAKIHIENNLVDKNTNLHELSISCQKIGEKIINSDVKDISLAQLLESLIEMMNQYKMDSRPELMLLQKTLLLVEGVGVALDENLNMWDLARPWVKEWAAKNIGFDAKIRDLIIDIIDIAKSFFNKKNSEKCN